MHFDKQYTNPNFWEKPSQCLLNLNLVEPIANRANHLKVFTSPANIMKCSKTWSNLPTFFENYPAVWCQAPYPHEYQVTAILLHGF